MNYIYINGRFLTQNITGVQRFALQVCLELIKLRGDIVFLVPSSIDKNILPKEFNIKTVGKKDGLYWEQIELPRCLNKQGIPILLNLCNRGPIFYKNNIVVLHDVTFRRYPKSVSFLFGLIYRLMIPVIIKNSRQLLTVSTFSRREILYFYPYAEKKGLEILYNAVDKNFKLGDSGSNKYYFLAVSSDYLHKNFESLIKAFILLNDDRIKLKIVGSKGTVTDKYSVIKNIEFVGRVSDDELIDLYQSALAFVFPSLYEGFGIPPLEAQACGCPVISSNQASMPEVLGSSAIFFDPLSINDIADKMHLIIENIDLCNKLINDGLINVKRFSWRESANKLNNILENIQTTGVKKNR